MSVKNISIKLLEGKYSKVTNYTLKDKQILIESVNGDVTIDEDEKGDLSVTYEGETTPVSEEKIDQELGILTETQNKVSAKELAKILSINNTKGRTVKESDVDNKMLDAFNSGLKTFASTYKNFDVFGDDYDGKETDAFVDLLVSISNNTKGDLFEHEDIPEAIAQAIESEDDIEKLKESVKTLKMQSPTYGGSVEQRLKEAVGSPFSVGTPAYKIRKGIPLKEAYGSVPILKQISLLTGSREQAVEDFLKRIDVEEKDFKYVLDALKKAKITGSDFTTAMLGKPNNEYEKKVLKGMGL